MTDFSDVGDFHRKFGLHTSDDRPGPTGAEDNTELMLFREKFLTEELAEFAEGLAEGDHAKMFDALIDLVYVALGTAHLLGYPWQQGWDKVQEANMAKVRAKADGSDSKRGSSFDVVKPPGWTPPDIESLLLSYGFKERVPSKNCPGCGKDLADEATTCGPRPLLQSPPGKRLWCSLEGDWF